MNRRILLCCQPHPLQGRPTAALLLFAVCQRSLLLKGLENTIFQPRPRKFSESECKGTTIPRTDKIFSRFFFIKTQLFFADPRTGTCKAGAGKHEIAELVQKMAMKDEKSTFSNERNAASPRRHKSATPHSSSKNRGWQESPSPRWQR